MLSNAQIRWRTRRGMLELDMLLLRFLDEHYDTLTDSDKELFAELLEESDPNLFSWLLGHTQPSRQDYCDFLKKNWFIA